MSEETETALPKTDAEWRERLDPMQYQVLREGGTEYPFTRRLLEQQDRRRVRLRRMWDGIVRLGHQIRLGTGWPSFWEAMDPERIETRVDTSHGMVRTEVLCKACGGHLGHVFPDGPNPTGMRYCLNSCSLDLKPSE